MLDDTLFSATANELNESNQAHAVNYATIMIALLEKGIVTTSDFDKARAQAISIVEQEWAQKREEAAREFSEKHDY